jgi:hypothetical protein
MNAIDLRKILNFCVILIMITSCVSRGKYLVLCSKANDLRKINTELRKSKLKLTIQKNSITNEIAAKNKIIQ